MAKESTTAPRTEAPVAPDLVRVEAIKPGTYPEIGDPRRESFYAVFRHGRITENGKVLPGAVFFMRREDLESAKYVERHNVDGWVRELKDGELAQETALEAPIPMTTAPRGYGQVSRY